jgi:hypothetical protein
MGVLILHSRPSSLAPRRWALLLSFMIRRMPAAVLFSLKLNRPRLTSIQNRYSKNRDGVNLIIRSNKTRAWSKGSSVGCGRIDGEKDCEWDRIFNKLARTSYGLFNTIFLRGPNKGLQATWQGVQSLRWDAFQESV